MLCVVFDGTDRGVRQVLVGWFDQDECRSRVLCLVFSVLCFVCGCLDCGGMCVSFVLFECVCVCVHVCVCVFVWVVVLFVFVCVWLICCRWSIGRAV